MLDSPLSLATAVLPISTISHSEPGDFTQSVFIPSNPIFCGMSFDVGQANDPTLPPGNKFHLQTTLLPLPPTDVEVGQSPGSNTPPLKIASNVDLAAGQADDTRLPPGQR
jgi:hypothetical protein